MSGYGVISEVPVLRISVETKSLHPDESTPYAAPSSMIITSVAAVWRKAISGW